MWLVVGTRVLTRIGAACRVQLLVTTVAWGEWLVLYELGRAYFYIHLITTVDILAREVRDA